MRFVSLAISLDNPWAISLQLVGVRTAHHDIQNSGSYLHHITMIILMAISQIYDPITCQCSRVAALSGHPWQATQGINGAVCFCPASQFSDRAPIVHTPTITIRWAVVDKMA